MSTRKITDSKYEYLGHRPDKKTRIALPFNCGHLVAIGLAYEEAHLIGVRLHNDYKGKYEVSQIREERRDTYRLTLSIPNTVTQAEAKILIRIARANVKAYQHEIQPYVFVRK